MAYKINIDGFIGDAGFLGGDSFTLKDLNRLLDAMPTNTKVVDVTINSGGGYCTEGFAIHDRLATLEEIVNTKVLGIGGSIATIIAQAPKSQGKGGIRSGYENSDYFIHPPSWSPQSPDPIEADELQRIADDLLANQNKIADFYAKVGNGTPEKFLEIMKEAKSIPMTDAKELGLIDSIITTNIKAATVYKFAAHVTKPVTYMATIEEKIGTMFSIFKEEMKTMFKPAFKNEMHQTSEGVQIWYEGGLEVGKKVYADEAMTKPAPDGVHTVDGKKCTIAGGEVTNVEAVEDSKDLEAANKKITELTAQLAAKDGEVTAKIDAAIASKETEVKATIEGEVAKAVTQKETELTATFENKFTAFKATIFTGDKLKPELMQNFRDGKNDGAPGDPIEALRKYRAEKAEKEAAEFEAKKKKKQRIY